MTKEQVEYLVTRAMKIDMHKTRQICGIKGKCINTSTFVGRCMNDANTTWKLLRFCISKRIYPKCAVCGQYITVANPNKPNGLTKGHIISKFNGGKNIVTNLNPEHLECNMKHAEADLVSDNYDIGLSIRIKTTYALGGKMNRDLLNDCETRISIIVNAQDTRRKVMNKTKNTYYSQKSRGGGVKSR